MTITVKTSNDLIDDLVRTLFRIEPAAMAALAHGDEAVRLRRMPGAKPTQDPLDGAEILVRRTLVISQALREGGGAVSLVTERQAVAAGWPNATVANAALLIAWGMAIAEPATSSPILLEPDENARGAVKLIRVGRALPTLATLLAARRQARRIDLCALERATLARASAPPVQGRRIASLHDAIKNWLGVDVMDTELPSDRWNLEPVSGNARAAGYLAWVAAEIMDLAAVVEEEDVTAVRLKTEADAHLAGAPDATAANLALLLAAAISHGMGTCTLQFLLPRPDVAEALVAVGERIRHRRVDAGDDDETATVDGLELRDAAARGFVHIGRYATRPVADRLYDTVRRRPEAGC